MSVNWGELATRPESLTEVVASALRKALLSGDLAPGDKLVEAEIARQMGISRGPVREAIRMLEQHGLVHIEPRKGACVASLSIQDVKEICTLRAALEGLAIRLGLENDGYDPATVSRLQDCIERMKASYTADDPVERLDPDREFHRIVYEKAQHKLLSRVLSDLRAQIELFMVFTEFAQFEGPVMSESHQPVLDAIIAKDADLAEQAVKDHIIQAGERLIALLATTNRRGE